MNQTENALQLILNKLVDNKKIFGTSFAIKKNNYVWQGASGNLVTDDLFFIASTTKLFTTAIILYLNSKQQLSLEDKINKYLDNSILNDLHVLNGTNYAYDITIKHLLAHTSGLPDYFQGKLANRKSLEQELVIGNDQSWSFEQAIEKSKSMKPIFVPGAKGKANYADTNFQLLGKIIETITNKSYATNCQDLIISKLNLVNTYLYVDALDTKPATLFYKSNKLYIPKAMTSFGADGGIVSTSSDLLIFIEAFFTGKLFPIAYINELQVWNNIFFPMKSGVGIHLFKLPWIFNPTGAVPDFIGHSGLSGTLAFYIPKENIFIAGTVNQVAHPDLSFKAMIKLTQKLKKV
jgi:D-alanyl-D-alanine carboxypeptidase